MFDFQSEWTEWEREMPIPFYPLVFCEPWFRFIMLTISLALKLLKDYQAFYSEKSSTLCPEISHSVMQALKFVNVLLASSLFVCLFFFFGHSLEENEEETDNNGPATTVGVSFYHFFYECFSNVITIVICFHQPI